jgi:hypothetical protein
MIIITIPENSIRQGYQGATIDLKSFLQDTSVANPGAGFAAAIADYYETQYKIIPNRLPQSGHGSIIRGKRYPVIF